MLRIFFLHMKINDFSLKMVTKNCLPHPINLTKFMLNVIKKAFIFYKFWKQNIGLTKKNQNYQDCVIFIYAQKCAQMKLAYTSLKRVKHVKNDFMFLCNINAFDLLKSCECYTHLRVWWNETTLNLYYDTHWSTWCIKIIFRNKNALSFSE